MSLSLAILDYSVHGNMIDAESDRLLAAAATAAGWETVVQPIAPGQEVQPAAERVWLRSVELRSGYELRGEFDEFPPELERLLADPHLGLMRAGYEVSKQEGWRAPEGAVPLIKTKPLPGVTREGSLLALQTCVDTRPVPLLDPNGQLVSEGRFVLAHLFFKYVEGDLRLFIADSQGEIEECPF